MPPEGALGGHPTALSLDPFPSGRSTQLLGMRIDELTYPSAIAQIRRWAEARQSRYVCVATVHMVMEAHDDPKFQTIVNNADLIGSDGVPVMWVCRHLGLQQSRVFGPELTLRLCAMASQYEIPVGFYGSTPDIIEALVRNLRARFPRLQLAYAYSPPFRDLSEEEMDRVAAEINNSGARLLFVGLGCPKQERWMARARPRVQAVMLGVGWAFDICAGQSKPAATWIQNIGMEWFYRLLENPRKLWKRHLKNNPRFLLLILLQFLGTKRFADKAPARGR
jgi:N-acetylglucosaminyldiphosphoundecaprenol N-acetyl-beta-D-mannosaminyltransferase